jgi:tetratricopeptide (TPR) repeat protein
MPYSYLLSDENDPVILANRSRAFTLAGCFSEALKDANQAIQKNPRMAKAHYRKAQALDGMGQLYEASASYLACLIVEKDNAVVKDRLWKLLKTVLGGVGQEVSQETIDQLLGIVALCQQDLSFRDIPSVCSNLPVNISQEDFHCALCCRLMFQPTTTPCGHTFCSSCLNQSLDHRPSCPVCRAPLQDVILFQSELIVSLYHCVFVASILQCLLENLRYKLNYITGY